MRLRQAHGVDHRQAGHDPLVRGNAGLFAPVRGGVSAAPGQIAFQRCFGENAIELDEIERIQQTMAEPRLRAPLVVRYATNPTLRLRRVTCPE